MSSRRRARQGSVTISAEGFSGVAARLACRRKPPPPLALGVWAVALGLALPACSRSPSTVAKQAAGREGKVFFSQLVVTDVRMSAAQNFLGQTVTTLDAKVTNQGLKTVRRAVLELEFHDMLNQVVLREKAYPITPRAPPLKAGETRAFRISFEHMPADWNQATPTIAATEVEF